MKKIFFTLALIFCFVFSAQSSFAVTRVKSYYKPSIHRVVVAHYRSSPNKVKFDNYSTKGNYNPYTGKKGYKNLY